MSDPGTMHKTAVIVEDDPDIRHLIVEVLEAAGFSTVSVGNGIDGVRAVLSYQPLITTLDVNMPGIDGFEAARRIRAQSDTYIIMITGLEEEADVVLGLGAGADEYVVKPFRPRELRARVESLLRRPRGGTAVQPVAPRQDAAGPSFPGARTSEQMPTELTATSPVFDERVVTPAYPPVNPQGAPQSAPAQQPYPGGTPTVVIPPVGAPQPVPGAMYPGAMYPGAEVAHASQASPVGGPAGRCTATSPCTPSNAWCSSGAASSHSRARSSTCSRRSWSRSAACAARPTSRSCCAASRTSRATSSARPTSAPSPAQSRVARGTVAVAGTTIEQPTEGTQTSRVYLTVIDRLAPTERFLNTASLLYRRPNADTMKNKISKAVASLAIAAAAVFAAPAVASAYTPTPADGTVTITAGGTATVEFTGFIPGETVTFTLTGAFAGSATLAQVAAAADESISTEKDAEADGSASVDVTPPTNATGEYTLTASGDESGAAADSVTITVAATGGEGEGGVLTPTGFDGDSLLGLWIGGGVLVLAGASIAVATSVRRSRQTV